MSFIRDIYTGEARDCDIRIRTDKYDEIEEQNEKLKCALKETLDEEQIKLFDEIISNCFELEFLFGLQRYTLGIKFALKLSAEVFTD